MTEIIQSLAATAKVEIRKWKTEIREPRTHACRVKVDERGQQGSSSHAWSSQQKVVWGGVVRVCLWCVPLNTVLFAMFNSEWAGFLSSFCWLKWCCPQQYLLWTESLCVSVVLLKARFLVVSLLPSPCRLVFKSMHPCFRLYFSLARSFICPLTFSLFVNLCEINPFAKMSTTTGHCSIVHPASVLLEIHHLLEPNSKIRRKNFVFSGTWERQ